MTAPKVSPQAATEYEALDLRRIPRNLPSDQYKCGDEFKPFHPSASHVPPDYRDGWNRCWLACQAEVRAIRLATWNAAIKAAARAADAEQVSDDTGMSDDRAYNQATRDCAAAIEALKEPPASLPPKGEGEKP